MSLLPHRGASLRRLALGLALTALLPSVAAQTGGPRSPGYREATWPSPTAEDWARPCLIHWERSLEDAVAVSRETGKPILVCVNMDGEIASEYYAGIKYRQPETAELYNQYVCVIASVYRHNPRDYDDEGHRIPCPRFGSVTCGEHMAVEPKLYSQYFQGQRVAPRHIGLELDGQELYDVFYAWDVDSVIRAVENGIDGRPAPTPPPGDRPLPELVTSPEELDRALVEQRYDQGSRPLRLALLKAALASGPRAPVDLLRLAILGDDAELARMGRTALAQADSPKAVDLIVEALRDAQLTSPEHEQLVGALERLGASSPRARALAVIQHGLADTTTTIDVGAWQAALDAGQGVGSAPDPARVKALLDRQDAILAGDDAAQHLDLAEAFLAQTYGMDEREREDQKLVLMDARNTARAAERLGATGWRVDADLAVADYYLGDLQPARQRAEQALLAGPPDDPEQVRSWNAMAVLAIFAQAREDAIKTALKDATDWPPQWLADVHAACSVLVHHPAGTADQIGAYVDFLRSIEARREASAVLREGLLRFPDSERLHAALRRSLLEDQGLDALEATYERMLAQPGAAPQLLWYAGRASLLTAEYQRRAGRDDLALAAYDRAIDHFERDIAAESDVETDADAQIALALAGRARLDYEQGRLVGALAELLASLQRSPDTAATQDGLNISAIDTARMLMARLIDQGDDEQVARLRAALDGLDPELLRLPPYERFEPGEDPSSLGNWPGGDPGRGQGRRPRRPAPPEAQGPTQAGGTPESPESSEPHGDG